MPTPRKINSDILLNLWAEGRLSCTQLARRLRCSDEGIRSALYRARKAGDPRAVYRTPVHARLQRENDMLAAALKDIATNESGTCADIWACVQRAADVLGLPARDTRKGRRGK